MFPQLSAEEVSRFVALESEGRERLRAGDEAGAEAAHRGQIAIFAGNPGPYVSLALLAARRGDRKGALEQLRAAVVRGFTDLGRFERAEVWKDLRGAPEFLGLQDAAPAIVKTEESWGGWETFRAARAPQDLMAAIRDHDRRSVLLDLMAPALGPRLARVWHRLNDRAAAALLEAYLAERPGTEDAGEAVTRLVSLYSGGPLLRWEVVPAEVARRLRGVARTASARFAGGTERAGALVCRALAGYSTRDRRGTIPPATLEEIRDALGEVIARHADSPFLAAAVEGLVRSEAESGRMDRAAEVYRGFVRRRAADPTALEGMRNRLGDLALRAGGIPEFRAKALDGAAVDPESLHGKVVVIDFWATWCVPCLEGFRTLRRLEDRFGDRVAILGVSLDRADDVPVPTLESWIARERLPGRHVFDGRGWDSDLVKAFGVKEIPFSVVVGPDGSVLAVDERGRDLEKAVQTALRTEGAGP